MIAQLGGEASISIPSAFESSAAVALMTWFIASETAESSIAESPSPVVSGVPIIAAASCAASAGSSTKRFDPSSPDR